MEDSDDNLSFASAPDTDHETESFYEASAVSVTSSVELSRTSSPTCSVTSRCSFRRRTAPKRPAPQPPGPQPPPKVVQSPDVVSSATSTKDCSENAKAMSFVREFHKSTVEAVPCVNFPVPISQNEKPLTGFVSHPIRLLPDPKGGTQSTSSSPSAEQTIEDPSGGKASVGDKGGLTHLQLRLIDDVSEPLSQSLPLSSPVPSPHLSFPPLRHTYLPKESVSACPSLSSLYSDQPLSPHQPVDPASPLYPTLPYQPQENLASSPPPLSTIYADLPTPSHQLPVTDETTSPFYVASVHPGKMVPFSVQSSAPSRSPQSYVNVAPLTYVTQFSPPSRSSPFFNVSASTSTEIPTSPSHHPKGLRVVRNPLPLSHSSSDPGVNRILRGGFLLPPPGTGPLLDRLSETEEKEDEDDEVFLRQESDGNSNRELVSVGTGRRRSRRSRAERSDSVGVPQLYEDLLISSRFRLKVTFTNLTMVVIGVALLMPNSAAVLYNFFRLVFGTLFPAYYSYKAVRTKNVKEYVKWMMYWIVFAFFTCAETITDVFLSFWFPFYYEIKILVVLWLLSPATRGSSILYRKFVHPWLTRREEEIDECIAKAKQQGYSTVVQLGTKGVNYATSVIMQTAIKGGGGIVSQLKRSYSASEIGEDTADHNRNVKALPTKESIRSPSEEEDTISVSSGSYESEPRHRAESESSLNRPRGHSTGRPVRAGKTRSADVSETYFHDTTETVPQRRSPRTHDAGRTAEGGTHQTVTRRSRSGDIYATLPRTTAKRAAAKKRQT